MEDKDYKYKLTEEQFNSLLQEIQAVKAFNYKTFRKLTAISHEMLQKCEDGDMVMEVFREIMSFNFKQYKKLNYIIDNMKMAVDPTWKPHNEFKAYNQKRKT